MKKRICGQRTDICAFSANGGKNAHLKIQVFSNMPSPTLLKLPETPQFSPFCPRSRLAWSRISVAGLDVFFCSALVTCCARAAAWPGSLQLLADTRHHRVEPFGDGRKTSGATRKGRWPHRSNFSITFGAQERDAIQALVFHSRKKKHRQIMIICNSCLFGTKNPV